MFEEFFLYLFAYFTDPGGFPVVQPAIIKDELHVLDKLAHIFVLVCFKFLFYFAHVHRILNNILVILVDLLVYWLIKVMHILNAAKGCHKSVRYIFPMVVNWHRFVNWRYLYVLDFILILKKFSDFGILHSHFIELFLSDWSSLFSVKHLQNIFFGNNFFIDSRSLWLNNILRSRNF